ncbi:trimeric intracellular cation channel type B [Chlorella sorokiniana]|uniref:Trimeric intracellular cation channel type B n=1 Tax=Chlorella sorokiniana TaxID=3076 RepID=A0A2P6U0C4_CHLSO|nr:trimeric intracellular cation channel type B [Chlorella sorokiniana]|eukprot:PRW59772.1 trimeric intracellular cation channel type B [Chlorella sorokiniana]
MGLQLAPPDELLAWLDRAALAPAAVPFWLLVAGHSLTAVEMFRGYTRSWLDRQEAPIALFSKDAIGLSFTLTWWAYNYLPAGLGPSIAALPPVRSGAKVARAILRAGQIVQRTSAAAKLFPGLVGAPLVLGTLAGSGGKLLTDAFSRCAGYPSTGPSELHQPSYVLRSAALVACLHYGLVHTLGMLSVQQGLGLATSLLVAHSLATDLTGQPCDFTAPLGALFHKLTLIPEAGTAPTAAAATPAAKAKRTPRASRQRAAAAVVSSPEHTADEREAHEEETPKAAPASTRRRARRRTAAASLE